MKRWVRASAAVASVAVAGAVVVGVLQGSEPTTLPPVATVSQAPQAGTVAGGSLVVSTFNVCKVACDAPAPSWNVRRDRVARVITQSGLDVVGLQEVTYNPTDFAKTQFLDVQNLVRGAGFVAPTMPAAADQCRWTAADPHPCDHTTGILFNTGSVRQATTPNGSASAGTLPASAIADGQDPDSAVRQVSWAYLQGSVSSTGPFLVISVHTSNGKDAASEASRLVFGRALGAWADAWNAQHGLSGVPTIMLGDLNSYKKRQPDGIQQIMVNDGWLDAASAPNKRNVQYSTINHNPQLAADQQGFPAAPYVFKTSKANPVLDATRIDYVMARGGLSVVDYEVAIWLRPDGSFDPDYQASDHQMVRATISFGAGA